MTNIEITIKRLIRNVSLLAEIIQEIKKDLCRLVNFENKDLEEELHKVTYPQMRRFISKKEVLERLDIGKSTLDKHIKQGSFPQPIPDNGRDKKWCSIELDRYLVRRSKEKIPDNYYSTED